MSSVYTLPGPEGCSDGSSRTPGRCSAWAAACRTSLLLDSTSDEGLVPHPAWGQAGWGGRKEGGREGTASLHCFPTSTSTVRDEEPSGVFIERSAG